MQALLKNYPEGVPMLDPIADMKISDPDLPAAIERVEGLEARLSADPVHQVLLMLSSEYCLCAHTGPIQAPSQTWCCLT